MPRTLNLQGAEHFWASRARFAAGSSHVLSQNEQ